MNAPLAANDLDSLKFGIGQPVPRQEDPTLLRGQGRYTDDINLPNQAYAVMVRSQVAHGRHQGHRHRRSQDDAGRAGCLDRRRPERGRLRPAQDPDPGAQPRRHADEDADAPFPGHRQGALRRRSGGLRGRRHAGRGQGRGRGRRARHRVPAGGDRRARGGQARRTCCVRRRARQSLPRLPVWRQRQGGRGLRQGRARHPHAPGQQPHRGLRHGAALGDRHLRSGHRPLHAACRQPGRVRVEAPDGRSLEDQAGADARADRQCRRLVRHEGLALSRICRPFPRLEAVWAVR